MQDIKRIIEDPDLFKDLVKKKNLKIDIDQIIKLHIEVKDIQQKIENLRKERNDNADIMKQSGGKPSQELIDKGKGIKEELAKLEEEFGKKESDLKSQMWYTPQIVSDDTPIGPDESGNVEIKKWTPQNQPLITKNTAKWMKDHIELGESLNILDLERGVKTGGFRGYYLKNAGALMHMGLMMYGLKLMRDKGFQTFVPPTLVKSDALWGSGHFPFDEGNIYVADSLKHTKEDDAVEGDKKFLVGTAEPSILNYHRDEVIDESELPIKYAGFSQCYRSEIGGYGRDTKGIYRIHEFMKIEQVVMCKDDYAVSEEMHQTMLGYSEELLQALKLPYRVIQLCTGDMGAGKYKMFDIETWMPSRNSYGETHSASNLGDWQTRRLNIKVKAADGRKYYPHALNNTVVASPRILIAIWENYQTSDGSIVVPEVLREYVGSDVIKRR